MDFKSLFFTGEGRIGRQTFWIGWLMLLGVHVVAHALPLVGPFIQLAAFFAFVCLYAKRLHDMGRTAWWQLLPILLGPVMIIGSALSIGIGAVIAELSHGSAELAALAGVGGLLVSVCIAFVVMVAFTLWVGISEGQGGENRYGKPPLTPVLV